MRIPLACLLFASAAFAEPGDDARGLLSWIAASAQSVKTWRVEGLTTIEIRGGPRRQAAFRGAARGLSQMRLEDLCEGPGCLTATGSNLVWPHSSWTHLEAGLESAVVAGVQRVEFQGAEIVCEVVKAEYSRIPVTLELPLDIEASPDAPCTRVLCVERKRRLILRDQVTAKAPDDREVTVIVDFRNIERDPKLPASYFAPPASTGEPAAAAPDQANRPALPLAKRAAEYTEDAREARIQGVVKLSLAVDAEGLPHNVRVTQPLHPGLDRQAVEAVWDWRFLPALKDGKPVESEAAVEVQFRLAQEEPGDGVIRLPAPPAAARRAPAPSPAPAPVPETLLEGYLTALFVNGAEARTQRFSIGDPLKSIRGFLANGAVFESGASGEAPAAEVDPEWREVYCGTVRFVVNAAIATGKPFPAPRKLVLLVDKEDRVRAVALE